MPEADRVKGAMQVVHCGLPVQTEQPLAQSRHFLAVELQ